MNGPRIVRHGWGLAALCGALLPSWSSAQTPPVLEPPTVASPPSPVDLPPPTITALPAKDDRPIRPVAEGPLHEAFLSPPKDREPTYVGKAPPSPINERPGVDPPSDKAIWIPGYWEWNPGSKDYVWTTGTWRNPPPGRFWVNGYWKREDKGWYRVPGFWSDRQTDRIDWRKEGPPIKHPDDDPGPAPGTDNFYIPGHYAPDGDGVIWKKGFWAKAQPGWSWVPAQWVRQPEGWTYQEGFWDRTLEDRGTLFAPAQVTDAARSGNTTYQPLSQVAPEQYGQLYGALGRPNSNYDGYPGCYYDNTGRYYGYANYGNLGSYYGYLDYPYTAAYGFPYFAPAGRLRPVSGGGFGGFAVDTAASVDSAVASAVLRSTEMALWLLFPGYFGGSFIGLGGLGAGFGGLLGSTYYGWGLGYFPGYFGGSFIGLGGLGFGGFGFGGIGYGGFGFPFFGFGGSGFNAGFRRGFASGFNQGFNKGRNQLFPNAAGRPQQGGRAGNGVSGLARQGGAQGSSRLAGRNGSVTGSNSLHAASSHAGRAMAPASSHPFANPFRGNTQAGANRGVGANTAHWNTGFNGAHPSTVSHSVARPTFTSATGNSAGINRGLGGINQGSINRGTGRESRARGSAMVSPTRG